MNKDFIDIIREIRGSGQPGVPYTNGIWYELTMAEKDGNPGIYGDILAKYGVIGDNADAIQILADNIAGIQAIISAINAGVDFEEVMTLIPDVAALEAAMLTKVDKVAGSSLMTTVEHTKLQAIADEATKNETDSHLLNRANHTGTQSLDTTTDGVDRLAMTDDERVKLTNIADGANNYVHPQKHAVSILDGGTNYNKVIKTDGAGNVGFGDVPWADIAGKPVTFTPSMHEHAMSDIPSGSLSATRVTTTETRQFITAEQATALLDMEVKSNKGVANGYVPLDSNGKINTSFLNDLNLIEVFTPADLSSMLNLNSAQPGDIAYRLDTENTYMLVALPVSIEVNWKQLNAGLSVVSVNGLSGVVSLNSANIPEGVSNFYYTNERVDDRVAALLQAGTNVTLSYDDIGNTLTIDASDTIVNWSEIQSKPTTVAGYAISDVSTTSQMDAALALKANVESPVFTGNVTGLGIATGTSFNSITALASVVPVVAGTAAVGTSTTVARQDHVHPAQTTITGNAATATKLAATKTISGVAFDGSANINIEDRLGTAIASAATITIGTAGLGDYIRITGTTTITSFGTASTAGIRRTLIFDGALTLTHNATSLICVGGTNIVTVAGMVIEVVAETTVNWRVVSITHPSISATELGYLDGVTSAIQTQINAKQATLVSGTNIKTINSNSILGSGDLVVTAPSASQTAQGIIEIATDAEVQAGTDTTRAVTPAGLLSAFVNSKVATGYTKLPNGLIIQWGSGLTGPKTLPVTFPNGALKGFATQASHYGSASNVCVTGLTTTTLTIGGEASVTYNFLAIGY